MPYEQLVLSVPVDLEIETIQYFKPPFTRDATCCQTGC